VRTAYCFDLDGTITREEILPLLAAELDLYEEIYALTEATIKGVIPFRKSFLLRCRLLGELPVSRAQSVITRISLFQGVVDFIHAHKENCFLLTGNLDVWVKPLADMLGCNMYSSSASVENDRIINVTHVLNKGDAVEEIRKTYDRIVAIGDGMGDVPMFEKADVRIAFGGTHPPVQSLIQFTDYLTFSERSLCSLLSTQ
jgi:phosphoserine phosphatase